MLAVQLPEKRGHTVTVAVNGRMHLLHSKKKSFDLILMDIQTPETDGLEASAAWSMC